MSDTRSAEVPLPFRGGPEAQEIARRYPVRPSLVEYWLSELRLSPEAVDLIAGLTSLGYREGEVNDVVEKFGSFMDSRMQSLKRMDKALESAIALTTTPMP